jgi:acyl homoserine lactone synthase
MILVIDALNQNRFADVLDEMFQLRARVFGDRLGWQVRIEDGREWDDFDDLNPAYLVGLDDAGHVISCARFLQTTGPHMLSDVFHAILDGQPPLRSANIWESTRFCVDTQRLASDARCGAVARATSMLMVAMLEYAKGAGITDIVTVIDPVMNRVLKRSACAPYDYLGKVTPMGKVAAMAALLDCTPERIAALRTFAGITEDVFMPDKVARARLDARLPDLKDQTEMHASLANSAGFAAHAELMAYCKDQLDAAQTPSDRMAAQRLVQHLIASGMHPTQ